MPAEPDRLATRRQATAARREAVVARAETGIRALTKTQDSRHGEILYPGFGRDLPS